jgi:eukaryotic-like serine/threonine-protein kinase
MLTFKTGERKVLQTGAYYGRFTASGHLLYVHGGALFALATTGSADKSRGGPVQVLDDVASNSGSAAGQFDFSRSGSFVYRSGKADPEVWSIAALDASGARKIQPQLSKTGAYFTPRLSPDGRRLALGIETSGLDIYAYDLQNDVLTRLTFFGRLSYNPVWTPDGKHIVFQRVNADGQSLWWIRSDGAGEAQKLLAEKALVEPHSISPDGRHLAYQQGASTNFDIWTLPLDLTDPDHPKPGKPEPFAQTAANEVQPAFSPDGRWMAYASDESGVYEVYVRPFPGNGGGKWQISSGGGKLPVWSREGKNLFFESPDDRIMLASYAVNGKSFAANKPRLWSDQQLIAPTGDLNFDVAPDGTSIEALVPRPAAEENKTSLHVTFLLNFFDELRRRTSQVK